jgi:hypothetical protein
MPRFSRNVDRREEVLSFLAKEGPANTYQIKKGLEIRYSVAHESVRALKEGRLIKLKGHLQVHRKNEPRILHNPAASAILQSDRVAAEKLNTLTLSDREKEELLKETVEAFQRNIGPAVTKLAETCLSYSDSEKSFEDFSLVFQSVIGQAALGTFDLWMKFQGPARRVLQGCQDPNLYQEPRG